MDYSKTVNLLQTPFPMKADLPVREPEMLKKWEETRLYDLIQQKGKGKPVFLLHDGPPYANGEIHMGHALNKTLKDFVVKYKTSVGFRSPYKPGWDCHGLPIEHALFKQLGKNKHQVSRSEFRSKATEYALGFVDKQRADFERLGVLGDWGHPYLTLANEYEAGILEIFFELQQKGFIYRGTKPGYWCVYDETALAEAEVEYADKNSDSVFVRFKIKPDTLPAKIKSQLDNAKADPANTYVMIWTTTPWTLPANVGLAFHPNEKYVAFKKDDASYIVAEKLLESIQGKLNILDVEKSEAAFGREYLGLLATNPIHGRDSRAVMANYVTMEDGTGVVHIAPGHGVDDFAVGQEYKLDTLSPVDERGCYTADVGHPDLVGKHVLKEANKAVMEILKDNLIYHLAIRHSYPHCWRCKNPIIFRATLQWFMQVHDKFRQILLKEIDSVRWEPSYGIHRIKGMVDVRPDWCLSRQRHWGTPIAVFYCQSCDKVLEDDRINRRVVELVREQGSNIWYDKSDAELFGDLNPKCNGCQGKNFRRETDILDVWFDSGVSWHSVVEQYFSDPKPKVVMYLEGSDQHRGWFQTSLIPSVAVRGKAPYDVVLTHGFVVDGKGHKMSKSLGNVISPQDIIKKFGADILRLWVAMSDYREDVRLSDDIVKHVIDMYRRFRNTFRFLLQNTSDFQLAKNEVPFEDLKEIDRWVLTYFDEVKEKVRAAYEAYEFHTVLNELNRFASVTLSGFYLDAVKDLLYCEEPNSPVRRSTQTALAHLTRGLCVLLAPLLTFTSEETFLELKRVSAPDLPESVLLDEWQNLLAVPKDAELLARWNKILAVRGLVNDELDKVRKAGVVKSSQEAKLVLRHADIEGWPDLPFIFQMAEVDAAVPAAGAAPSVVIKKTASSKCERCWRLRGDVGKDRAHPALCGRCVKVVSATTVKS